MESLLDGDEYMMMADCRSYIVCQDRLGAAYRDHDHWTRMSILNIARIGRFSSDRAIRDYCSDIGKRWPVIVRARLQSARGCSR